MTSKSPHGPLRVGIGGPVGSGKTALMEALCKAFRDRYDICAITNDIYTKEDALILTRAGALPVRALEEAVPVLPAPEGAAHERIHEAVRRIPLADDDPPPGRDAEQRQAEVQHRARLERRRGREPAQPRGQAGEIGRVGEEGEDLGARARHPRSTARFSSRSPGCSTGSRRPASGCIGTGFSMISRSAASSWSWET